MKNCLTATEAKKIWLRVLFKHTGNSIFDEYLAKVIPKLQALKFTYGGRIKKEHKSYAYINKHFPALLRKFKEEVNKDKTWPVQPLLITLLSPFIPLGGVGWLKGQIE